MSGNWGFPSYPKVVFVLYSFAASAFRIDPMFNSTFVFSALALALGACCGLAPAQNRAGVPADDTVLAEVDGVKLTLSDYDQKHPTGLFQARNAFWEAHRTVAQQFIDEYLLERQAKKEGLTVDQLIQRHVIAKLPPDPSDEVLRVYFEGVTTDQPFEAVKGQIVQVLRERRISKAKRAYVDSLRGESKIALRIGPPRAIIAMKDTPVRGDVKAPLLLVEYSDFECPYCQQVKPIVDKLMAEFKGKLALAYKDFPLPMHPRAPKAAEAAHCAGDQGKYWEYHDLLFASKRLEVPELKEQARELKLDGKAFDQCLDSGAKSAIVKNLSDEAQGMGVQGTPNFYLNGRAIGGNRSYEEFRKIIEEELSALPSGMLKAAR